jgi:transmembrane sensor
MSGELPESPEGWFARLRSGEMTGAERAAFDAWLARDPGNRNAIEGLSRLWGSFAPVRDDPAVLAMREEGLRAGAVARKRVWTMAVAVAAGLAAVAVAVVQLEGSWHPRANQGMTMNYSTRVGEKATVKLPDGTTLVLDTDSAIRTGFDSSRRMVDLVRGRAFFNVAKDTARPFSVTAAGNTVTALGTEFDVEITPHSMDVTLVSGRLRVRGASGAGVVAEPSVMELSAGQRMSIMQDGKWSLRPIDSRLDTGWLRGQLVFDEATLADIAAALNRYSVKKVEIPTADIANRHMSAVLQAGDVDTFVRAAENLGLARRGANDSQHVVLMAP